MSIIWAILNKDNVPRIETTITGVATDVAMAVGTGVSQRAHYDLKELKSGENLPKRKVHQFG